MCDFTNFVVFVMFYMIPVLIRRLFVSEQHVTIPESKDTIAILLKSLFKWPKLPEINKIFITTCVKETFH